MVEVAVEEKRKNIKKARFPNKRERAALQAPAEALDSAELNSAVHEEPSGTGFDQWVLLRQLGLVLEELQDVQP